MNDAAPKYKPEVEPHVVERGAVVVGLVSAGLASAAAACVWPVVGPRLIQPCPLFSVFGLSVVAVWAFFKARVAWIDVWVEREMKLHRKRRQEDPMAADAEVVAYYEKQQKP